MRPITSVAVTAAAALALTAAASAAQAATCSCAVHHHRRHVAPAHYYVPSYRPHRLVRHVAYAEPWGYPPQVVYGPPEALYGPAYGPVYEGAYLPPPPPWVGPPGYEAVDAAYVGPDPGWRPVRHRRPHPTCHRP